MTHLPETLTIDIEHEFRALLGELANVAFSGDLMLSRAEEIAKIYFAHGQIIWAFASNQVDSFQSILINEFKVPPKAIADAIRHSRAMGHKDISFALKDLDVADEDVQKEIVKRHTIAAINRILSWNKAESLIKPADNPEFSFLFDVTEICNEIEQLAFQINELEPLPESIPEQDALSEVTTTESEQTQRLSEIEGLVSMALIDGVSGMPIFHHPQSFISEVELISAHLCNIFNSAFNLWTDLLSDTGGSDRLQENILVTQRGKVAMRLLGDNYILCLVLISNADTELCLRKAEEAIATMLSDSL